MKTSKPKRRNAVRQSAVPRPILPVRQTANLSYTQNLYLVEPGAGTGALNTWRLTDLYDPDFTGVGQQPVGFDQLSALYSRFRVLQVSVCARVTCTGVGAIVTLVPSSKSVITSTFAAHPSLPYAISGIAASGAPPLVLKSKAKAWDLLKMRKREYLDDMDFTCTASSSPTRGAFVHLSSIGVSGTAQSLVVSFSLNYVVELSEPVAISLS